MAEEDIKNSAALLRHQLASIDWSDIHRIINFYKEIKLGKRDQEVNEIANATEIYYRNHMEGVLKVLLFEQAQKIAGGAERKGAVLFGRGTYNGIALIDEWFKGEYKKSLARFENPEESEDLDFTGLKGLID